MSYHPNATGLQFIASIIAQGSMDDLGDCSYLFQYAPVEAEIYGQFDAYIKKYGKVPAKDTFEDVAGVKLPDASEGPDYYRDKLRERHLHRAMVSSSEKAAEFLEKKDPKSAFEILKKMVHEAEAQQWQPHVHDFKNSCELLMKSIAAKLSGDDNALSFGWPTLDDMSAGMTGGDLISLPGRPGSGKTFLLLYTALHVWRKQKRPVLFVSMEMSHNLIMDRLAAILASIPYDWIKTGGFPTFPVNKKAEFKALLQKIQEEESSLRVVDANLAASVGGIAALCALYKPAAVFVDGAYLLKVEGKFGKWEKIGEACRELKQLATRYNVPVIASWQLNRESTKAKVAGLEHIAGSDEISQLSSVVLGLFEEESISTVRRRKIDILKGRGGEQGAFYTNWCFNAMNFTEATLDVEFEVI